jgi:hypothetical protein
VVVALLFVDADAAARRNRFESCAAATSTNDGGSSPARAKTSSAVVWIIHTSTSIFKSLILSSINCSTCQLATRSLYPQSVNLSSAFLQLRHTGTQIFYFYSPQAVLRVTFTSARQKLWNWGIYMPCFSKTEMTRG